MSEAASPAARRYAEAAFEVARATRDVKGWQKDMAALSDTFADPQVESVFANPRVPDARKIGIALGLAPDDLKADRQNFLKLLVLARRTGEVPFIRDQFEALVAEAEGRVELQVTLAREPAADERKRISSLLAERIGQEATVEYRVDPAILGGLIIRRGDHVVDGSVRRRLAEMREDLVAS